MRQLLIDKYLDRVNNYLSVDVFAEHNGISREFAVAMLAEGERLHEENVLAAHQYEYTKIGGQPESASGASMADCMEAIRNLKANESLTIYQNDLYVGGAFVDAEGKKTVSFLKK